MSRKLIYAIIALALAAGGGYYYYEYMREGEPATTLEPTYQAIAPDSAVSPVASNNPGDPAAIWYATSTGQLMRLDLAASSATEAEMPAPPSKPFRGVYWPADGKDFIVRSGEGFENKLHFYDADKKAYTQLPGNVVELDWLPGSQKIVMAWKSSDDTGKLVVSDPDGTNYKVVASLPWFDFKVYAAPTGNKALVIRPDPKAAVGKIYLFDLETGKYTEVVATGNNLDAQWSPMGKYFAYTKQGSTGPRLWLHDMAAGTERDLGVTASMSKVAFSPSETNIYVLETQPDASELLKVVDIPDGDASVLYDADTGIRATGIFLVGSKVYFISSADGRLYAVQ